MTKLNNRTKCKVWKQKKNVGGVSIGHYPADHKMVFVDDLEDTGLRPSKSQQRASTDSPRRKGHTYRVTCVKGGKGAKRRALVSNATSESLMKALGEVDALKSTLDEVKSTAVEPRFRQEDCKTITTQTVVKETFKKEKLRQVKNFTWTQTLSEGYVYDTKLIHYWSFVRDKEEEHGMRNFGVAGAELYYKNSGLSVYRYRTHHVGLWGTSKTMDLTISTELFYHVVSSIGVYSTFSDEQLMNIIRSRMAASGSVDITRYEPEIYDNTAKMVYCYLRSLKSLDFKQGFQWPGPKCPEQLSSDIECERLNSRLFPERSMMQKLTSKKTIALGTVLSAAALGWALWGRRIPRPIR